MFEKEIPLAGKIRKTTQEERLAYNKLITVSPENAYILGFLWADGWIAKANKGYAVKLSIKQSDFTSIADMFPQELGWRMDHRPAARESWQPISLARITNKPFCDFLAEHDYRIKSYSAPTKILEWLPETLHRHWWHGFYDGDGCLYLNPKHYTYQIAFAGSYDQNWSAAQLALNKIEVQPTVKKQISKKGHRSSQLRFVKKVEVVRFLEWIHNDVDFGLDRKRLPDQFIKDYLPRNCLPKGSDHFLSKLSEEQVLSIREEYLLVSNVSALSRKYNVSWSTIDNIIKRKTWKHVQ